MRDGLGAIADRRIEPRIPTRRVLASLFIALAARLGSLNALEKALRGQPPAKRWNEWIGGAVPSADRLGEVAELMDLDGLRGLLIEHYFRRKRNKTLEPIEENLRVLILDGHEMCASYLRTCKDCLEREVAHGKEKRTQYYHRYVMAYLQCRGGRRLLDLEMQRPGEGEIATARRLLERLRKAAPRAFNVVSGDALYLDPGLCAWLLEHGLDFVCVLKNENRELIQDFRGLAQAGHGETLDCIHGRKQCICRDIEGFDSWTQLGKPVRVVQSLETCSVTRQRTKENETCVSQWLWATSLTKRRAGIAAILRLGHGRWDIENHGFNELVTYWHADHVYHHEIAAMTALLLILFLVYNLFHVFLERALKPALRVRYTPSALAERIATEFYAVLPHPT